MPLFPGLGTRLTDRRANMRRLAFPVLVLWLAFLMAPRAEAQSPVSVRGNVGASFFQSPDGLSSVLNSGINLGIGTTVDVHDGLGITLRGSYDRFTLNGDNVALVNEGLEVGDASSVDGGALDLMGVSTGVRYSFQNRTDAHPYITGGVGVYRTRIAPANIYQNGQLVQETQQRTTTAFGYHMALGVDFRINDRYTFFFEPRYIIVNTDGEDFGVGTSTRFVPVQIGLDVHL